MDRYFVFDSYEELEEALLKEKHPGLVKTITYSIIQNIDNDLDPLYITDIEVEGYVFEMNLDRNKFRDTLIENLPYFEKWEEYETCSQIKKLIEDLDT